MEIKYKKVPTIFTSKDLDYLKDSFNICNINYIITNKACKNISSKEINTLIKEINNEFYNEINEILDLIMEVKNINEN